MAILRAVGLLCIVIFQLSSCRPDLKRVKRDFELDDMADRMSDKFEHILEELAIVDNHVHDVNYSLIEHIHGHVENKLDHLEDLVKRIIKNQRYFELCVMNANPCENGGTCYVEMEAESYSCACPDGWMGDRCQEVESCFDVECFNGGSCNNGTCYCLEGFYGRHCDIENDCTGRDSGFYPTTDCRFYIWCWGYGSAVQMCPPGTIVYPVTARCDILWPLGEDCP